MKNRFVRLPPPGLSKGHFSNTWKKTDGGHTYNLVWKKQNKTEAYIKCKIICLTKSLRSKQFRLKVLKSEARRQSLKLSTHTAELFYWWQIIRILKRSRYSRERVRFHQINEYINMIHPSSGIPVNSVLANDPIPFFIYVFARPARSSSVTSATQTAYVLENENILKRLLCLSGKTSKEFSPFASDVCRLFCVSLRWSLEFPDEQMPRVVTQSCAERMLTPPGQQLHERFGWILAGPRPPRRTQSNVMSGRGSRCNGKNKHSLVWNKRYNVNRWRKRLFNAKWQEAQQNIFSAWTTWLRIRNKNFLSLLLFCLASLHLKRSGIHWRSSPLLLHATRYERKSKVSKVYANTILCCARLQTSQKCFLAGCWRATVCSSYRQIRPVQGSSVKKQN